MKKQFGLQKVLDFRNKTLDREKAKLGELFNKERMMLSQMAEIIEEIKAKQSEQDAEARGGRFGFADLYSKYISVRENDLEYIKKQRDEVLKQAEAQKKVLQRALNDVKIMEKLKEKHLLNYAEYMLKQEELQIDEINITKHRDETL